MNDKWKIFILLIHSVWRSMVSLIAHRSINMCFVTFTIYLLWLLCEWIDHHLRGNALKTFDVRFSVCVRIWFCLKNTCFALRLTHSLWRRFALNAIECCRHVIFFFSCIETTLFNSCLTRLNECFHITICFRLCFNLVLPVFSLLFNISTNKWVVNKFFFLHFLQFCTFICLFLESPLSIITRVFDVWKVLRGWPSSTALSWLDHIKVRCRQLQLRPKPTMNTQENRKKKYFFYSEQFFLTTIFIVLHFSFIHLHKKFFCFCIGFVCCCWIKEIVKIFISSPIIVIDTIVLLWIQIFFIFFAFFYVEDKIEDVQLKALKKSMKR